MRYLPFAIHFVYVILETDNVVCVYIYYTHTYTQKSTQVITICLKYFKSSYIQIYHKLTMISLQALNLFKMYSKVSLILQSSLLNYYKKFISSINFIIFQKKINFCFEYIIMSFYKTL